MTVFGLMKSSRAISALSLPFAISLSTSISRSESSERIVAARLASVEELVGGIRAAAAGESSISPRIAAKLLAWMREGQAERRAPEAVQADLSEREIEVLRLLAAGKGNAEIAQELFISPKTVKNHIASILVKLQIENRIQAAVYAVKTGIV